MIITGLLHAYFFVAGCIFSDMFRSIRVTGYWPLLGCFLLSILWIPFFIWAVINIYSITTSYWYIRFAATIFEK